MNAPVSVAVLCGRVMQWLSSRPPGTQLVAQEREVRRVVAHADVLGEPDRADRVEAGLGARRGSRRSGPRPTSSRPSRLIGVLRPARPAPATASRRWPRRRSAWRRAAPCRPSRSRRRAAACRAAGRACGRRGRTSPPAPPPGSRPRREARAGVGHRRAEHQLVEPVGHVVVVVDRLGVAALGVPRSPRRRGATAAASPAAAGAAARGAASPSARTIRSASARRGRSVMPASRSAPASRRRGHPGGRRRSRGRRRRRRVPCPRSPGAVSR